MYCHRVRNNFVAGEKNEKNVTESCSTSTLNLYLSNKHAKATELK